MSITLHPDGRMMHGGINVTPKPMIDTFNFTATPSSAQTPVTDWARLTTSGFLFDGAYNTGMSLSSGVFTFPMTGRYLIIWAIGIYVTNNDSGIGFNLQTCTDGSTFSSITNIDEGDSGGHHCHLTHTHIAYITDTTNQKVRFATGSMTGGNIKGGTSQSYGNCTFLRLNDI